jgi:hypothetical protein
MVSPHIWQMEKNKIKMFIRKKGYTSQIMFRGKNGPKLPYFNNLLLEVAKIKEYPKKNSTFISKLIWWLWAHLLHNMYGTYQIEKKGQLILQLALQTWTFEIVGI